MIIYGVTVNESISQLFMAAMIPGLALALLFMTYIAIWSLVNRGKFNPVQDVDLTNLGRKVLDLAPVLVLIAAVIGSIYTGIATATEAAALGVLGSFILSAVQRSLTWASVMESITGAVRTSAMIMLILMGAGFLSLAMGFHRYSACVGGNHRKLEPHSAGIDCDPDVVLHRSGLLPGRAQLHRSNHGRD